MTWMITWTWTVIEWRRRVTFTVWSYFKDFTFVLQQFLDFFVPQLQNRKRDLGRERGELEGQQREKTTAKFTEVCSHHLIPWCLFWNTSFVLHKLSFFPDTFIINFHFLPFFIISFLLPIFLCFFLSAELLSNGRFSISSPFICRYCTSNKVVFLLFPLSLPLYLPLSLSLLSPCSSALIMIVVCSPVRSEGVCFT